MRVPIPERFKLRGTLIFIVLVVLAQQIEKTDVTFSLLTAVYLALFTFGYNIGGGLFYLAGAYIFFNGTLSFILGILYKIVVGEAAQTHLLVPNETMEVYCLGMCGLIVAAAVSRRLIPKRGLLADFAAGELMKQAAIGCLVLGILIQLAITGNEANSASFSSALGQINHFIEMSIILATTYEINRSNGRRSANWIVWTAGLWIFYFGVVVFSKQGMFTPLFCWLVPCVVLRYDFSKKQLVGGVVVGFIILYYLVPFSQFGRNLRTETGGANVIGAFGLLSHPQETRRLYLEHESEENALEGPHYYDKSSGLFDREEMLSVDDALISYSDQGNFRGFEPVLSSFENIIPRFLWKEKPGVGFGNQYARELGILGQDDETTGISFSPAGDAYHQRGFLGVLLLVPFVTFIFFFIGDSLAGDTRRSPWGLLLIALSAHYAPEGLLEGTVYLTSYGAFAVVIIALLSRYVLPIFANLLTGSERTRVRRSIEFRPTVRGSRINPLLRQPDPEPPAG